MCGAHIHIDADIIFLKMIIQELFMYVCLPKFQGGKKY